jgi:transposase-like protein
MTPAEFAACTPYIRNISPDRVQAARSALVDGETLAAIAARHGWSRQAVNVCVDTLWQALERHKEAKKAAGETIIPPGWQQVTLIAPSALIEKFRSELAAWMAGDKH